MGRRGPSLAEHSGLLQGREVRADDVDPGRVRPVVTRHCWVSGLAAFPGRWAGLVPEWRVDVGERQWRAPVAYAVNDDGRTMLVEAWVAARFLEPALLSVADGGDESDLADDRVVERGQVLGGDPVLQDRLPTDLVHP